jgi:hypothetical protein
MVEGILQEILHIVELPHIHNEAILIELITSESDIKTPVVPMNKAAVPIMVILPMGCRIIPI